VLAALLITFDEWLQWQIAALSGAEVPFARMIPPIAISILVFPLSAWLIFRIDAWRLGRLGRLAR
jgi:rod shape-determining protein MreD